jgi:hypothetical protein
MGKPGCKCRNVVRERLLKGVKAFLKILGSLLAGRPGPGREFADAPGGEVGQPGQHRRQYPRTGRTKRWQVYPLPPRGGDRRSEPHRQLDRAAAALPVTLVLRGDAPTALPLASAQRDERAGSSPTKEARLKALVALSCTLGLPESSQVPNLDLLLLPLVLPGLRDRPDCPDLLDHRDRPLLLVLLALESPRIVRAPRQRSRL